MASEWRTLTLREAGVTLIDCDHRTPPAAGTGYPYVTIPQLHDGRLDLSAARRITRQHFIDWTRKAKPQAYDVVLSRRCNPGETAVVPVDTEFALGQNLVLLRADGDQLYPPYLRWLARGSAWWEQIAKFLNVGAVFDSLRCADVPKFRLPVPPLDEQRAIAHILGALDDKIELNRRMSETLEAMARALFKSWFVDFDPVCAKTEGRHVALPGHLADLFPGSLMDSEVGEIPEGWKVSQLGDLLIESNQRIGDAPAPEYSSTNDGLQLRSELFSKTLAVSSAKNKLVRGGYLVFGLSRRVLNFGLMRDELGSVSAAYKVFKVREEVLSSDLLERLMRLKAAYFYMAVSASSREGQSVSSEGLNLLRVVVPPRDIQEVFYSFDSRFFERIAAAEGESRNLTALRDALLPNLLTGELRVKQAERIVAEAGV